MGGAGRTGDAAGMKRWGELAAEAPELAEAGRALFYQYKIGLAYLATLRRDGAPRLHPVCVTLADGGLYLFIGNASPKVHDLRRDGRCALHSFPVPDVDDEFMVGGRAERIDDPAVRRAAYRAYTATGATTQNDTLFEVRIERALHARYGPRPSWPPAYTRWRCAQRPGPLR
jgi:Pyridoxamine 5'-phosphate oxidase